MGTTDPATAARLKEIVNEGIELPTLPSIGTELLRIVHQPLERINVQRVGGIIETDPVLAARLLRMANSPFFGVARKVTSVGHALMLIGLEESLSFLNFYLLTHMMSGCPKLKHFDPEQLWVHAWATGTAARKFGRPQFLVQALPGELYLAGLFHDIGKVIFATKMQEDFQKSLNLAHERGIALEAAEREIIGIDHAVLGAHLLDQWDLPTSILEAVGGHHRPEQLDPRKREIASLIQLADAIVNRYEVGDSGTPANKDITETFIVREGKSPLADPGAIDSLCEEIMESLQRKSELIKSTEHTDPADMPAPEKKPAAARPAAPQPVAASAPRRSRSAAMRGLWSRVTSGIGAWLSS